MPPEAGEAASVETDVATVSGEAESSEAQEQEVNDQDAGENENQEAPAGEEEGGEEKAAVEEEGKEKKGPQKLTANERIQQLINENKGLKEKLSKNEPLTASELDALSQPEGLPPQAPPAQHPGQLDYGRINTHIQETSEKIEDLKGEGKFLEASRLEDELLALRSDIRTHEAKIREFDQQHERLNNERAAQKQMLDALDKASDVYRQQHQIPGELWNDMGVWFAQKCSQDIVLGQMFNERVTLQGPTAAVDWAYSYVKEHMAADLEKTVAKKETAKGQMQGVQGSQATGEYSTIKNYDDLVKLPDKKILEFKKSHPKRFQAIMDKALGS